MNVFKSGETSHVFKREGLQWHSLFYVSTSHFAESNTWKKTGLTIIKYLLISEKRKLSYVILQQFYILFASFINE